MALAGTRTKLMLMLRLECLIVEIDGSSEHHDIFPRAQSPSRRPLASMFAQSRGIEAGQGASVTTRRCLARGLGYEKPDTFDAPELVMHVHKLLENAQAIKKEAQEKQYPDHVRLKTARVKNGETLGRFADISNAVVLNADDAISDEAKKTAATLFDYVRDLLDLGDMASCSEKVGYNRDLEALLRELRLGATVYSALRPMKMCGENWEDKTPVSLEVGYLTVVPTENVLEDMFVPRRCRLSF